MAFDKIAMYATVWFSRAKFASVFTLSRKPTRVCCVRIKYTLCDIQKQRSVVVEARVDSVAIIFYRVRKANTVAPTIVLDRSCILPDYCGTRLFNDLPRSRRAKWYVEI